MLQLLLGDDEGPVHVRPTPNQAKLDQVLAIPRAITFLLLLVPFTIFAFAMTALFGAAGDHH